LEQGFQLCGGPEPGINSSGGLKPEARSLKPEA
jgi:hypothetical protein